LTILFKRPLDRTTLLRETTTSKGKTKGTTH